MAQMLHQLLRRQAGQDAWPRSFRLRHRHGLRDDRRGFDARSAGGNDQGQAENQATHELTMHGPSSPRKVAVQ